MNATLLGNTVFALAVLTATMNPAQAHDTVSFPLIRTAGLPATCAPDAAGYVRVKSFGPVEVMDVVIKGLPPKTNFDAFVIQVPNAPFGLSWYQGDIETRYSGKGISRFVGRFNEETFLVAPGVAPAPPVHSDPIADAIENPKTAPIHTYHIGIWFNSPQDAAAAGCPDKVTPFNGEHNAGVQILNTGSFADDQGPLRQLQP